MSGVRLHRDRIDNIRLDRTDACVPDEREVDGADMITTLFIQSFQSAL